MSQYVDNKNSLNHGLGVGGGRGRPKGSRNGYINPNAAYMKDYKIVGEIAQDPEALQSPSSMARSTSFASGNGNRQPTGTQRNATGQPVQRVNTQRSASRPVNSVQAGKSLLDRMLSEKSSNVINDQNLNWMRTQNYPDLGDDKFNRVLDNTDDPTNKEFVGKASDGLLKEQVIPEKIIREQYITETKPIETKPIETKPIETKPVVKAADFARDNIVKPAAEAVGNAVGNAANAVKDVYEDVKSNVESTLVNAGDQAKAWWEDLLDWGGNAVKTVSDFATSAIDTGTKAFNDATKWVSDRFNDATSWASTAYKDVADWIGDRGTELDRWWNGYDEKQVYGSPEKRAERQASHVNGVRENIEKAVGDATGAAGKWLTDRGEDLNRWWNGYDEKQVHGNPEKRAERQASHVNGARENIEAAVNNAANAARNAIGEASENVVRTVRDAAGNVHQAVVDTAGNIVGWVGERAEDVSNWWNGTDVVRGDSKGVTSVEHTPGVRENVEELVGAHLEKVRDAAGNIRDAIVDAKGQFVDWAGERIEEADEWWNGSDRVTGDQNGVTNVEHTPGARENIEKAIQDTGKAAAEAGEKAVSAARTAAGAGADIVGENIVGWTNSPIAQEAQKAGMSTPMLYALASAYLSGGSNGVDRNAYENMLSLYANGDLNDDNIWYAINDINHK